MKPIKIYVVIPDDLYDEYYEFAEFIDYINKVYNDRGYDIERIPHGEGFEKIKGYDIKDCDMLVTLYYTKFGEDGKNDFIKAHNAQLEGHRPHNIFTFFKDSDELEEKISSELKEFKDYFASSYKHFFAKFEHIDNLKLKFIMQLEKLQNKSLGGNSLKVDDEHVYLGKLRIVDLNNVPFAKLNDDFARMRDELAKLKSELEKLDKKIKQYPSDPSFPIMRSEKISVYNKLKDDFDQHQNALFNTALRIANLDSNRITDRMKRAIDYFENGKASEANAVLSEAEHDVDIFLENFRKYKKLTEQDKENIMLSIETLKLKTKTVMADKNIPLDKRLAEVENLFEKSLEFATEIDYDYDKYYLLITDYINFLNQHEKNEKATEISNKYQINNQAE